MSERRIAQAWLALGSLEEYERLNPGAISRIKREINQ